jgi:hemerythrin superfamily protein
MTVHNPLDPINHPLDGLLRDHQNVRMLAAAWGDTDDLEVKQQAGRQLLQALHNHSRVEESVFYPGVRAIDPAMVAHFEQQHQAVDGLVATLQGMTLDEPQTERLMGELIDDALRHIELEEREFFPKLEQAGLDMAPLGLEMQVFESNLIHMQARGGTPARR